MPTTPQLAVAIFILCIYIKKRGASPDARSTIRSLALPKLSKRAMLKTPRRCVYNSSLPTSILLEAKKGCIQYTL